MAQCTKPSAPQKFTEEKNSETNGLRYYSLPAFPPFLHEISGARTIPGKLLWILLLCLCFGGFSHDFIKLVDYYFTYPEATKFETRYTDSMTLPEIGICTSQPLNVSKLLNDNFTLQEISSLYWHFTSEGYGSMNSLNDSELGPEELEKVVGQSWESFLERNGPQCESLLLRCFENWNPVNCCSRVEKVFHEKLGTCYAIKNFVQTQGGPYSGLVLTLSTDKRDPRINGSQPHLPLVNGLIVEMSNSYNAPRTWHVREQVLVPANKVTFISLRTNHHKFGNSPKHPCRETVALEEFSKSACRFGIWNSGVEEGCNCSLLGFSDTMNLPTCPPWTMQACYGRIEKWLDNYTRNLYQSQCTEPCKQVQYSWTVSSVDLVADQVPGALSHSAQEKLTKDYYIVHIFYSSLFYTSMEELSVVNFDTVVSGVGGLLSLYLAADLVTLITSFAFAARWIYGKLMLRNAGTKKQQTAIVPTPREDYFSYR